jgi:HdeA/HdeB family
MKKQQLRSKDIIMAMARIFVATAAAFGMLSVISAPGGSAEERQISSYTCKEVMRESDTSRQAAVAFLHGYLLAKAGATGIDLDAMAKQTDSFVNRCLDNPAEIAVDAMAAVKR